MTETEKKALELVNAVRAEWSMLPGDGVNRSDTRAEALCRSIEAHEAFRQEVSDACERIDTSIERHRITHGWSPDYLVEAQSTLDRFIIAKPDPLVEAFDELHGYQLKEGETWSQSIADRLRSSLAKRGLEIVEKRND